MKFNVGDTIVHKRYGTGTVVGEKTLTMRGEKREYICIELTNDRGTLMVQPDEIDPEEVRETMADLSIIRDVFGNPPEELSDQHRSRQPHIQAKIRSNDPRKVAQVVRDLLWRKHSDRLTDTDQRLLDEAREKLLRELKLSPDINTATKKLNKIIDEAIASYVAVAS